MTSKELNEGIAKIDGMDSLPSVQKEETGTVSNVGYIGIVAPAGNLKLESILDPDLDTGKKIFYWGWYWREVDFDQQISLAYDVVGSTGFCESNKWGYPMVRLSKDDSILLRDYCEVAVKDPSVITIAAVNKFMEDHKPFDWKAKAQFAADDVAETMKMFREQRKW